MSVFFPLQESLSDSLVVTVTTTNIHTNPQLFDFSYTCRYDYDVPGAESVSGRTTERSSDTFPCIAPLRNQVPAIPTGRGDYKTISHIIIYNYT